MTVQKMIIQTGEAGLCGNTFCANEYSTWLEASEKLNLKLKRELDAYTVKVQGQNKNIIASSRMIAKAADIKDAFFSFMHEENFSKEKLLKLLSIDNLLEKLCVWYNAYPSGSLSKNVFDAAETVLDKYGPKEISPEVLSWEKARDRLVSCIDAAVDEALAHISVDEELSEKKYYMRYYLFLDEFQRFLREEATPQSVSQQLIDDLLNSEDPADVAACRMDAYIESRRNEIFAFAVTEPGDDDLWDALDDY